MARRPDRPEPDDPAAPPAQRAPHDTECGAPIKATSPSLVPLLAQSRVLTHGRVPQGGAARQQLCMSRPTHSHSRTPSRSAPAGGAAAVTRRGGARVDEGAGGSSRARAAALRQERETPVGPGRRSGAELCPARRGPLGGFATHQCIKKMVSQ